MSDTLALVAAVVAIAVLTFATRLSMIAVFTQRAIPPLLERGLRYVPAAVLAALIAPDFLAPHGTLQIALDNHKLIAGALAAAVAWRTKETLLPLIVGVVALYGLAALG